MSSAEGSSSRSTPPPPVQRPQEFRTTTRLSRASTGSTNSPTTTVTRQISGNRPRQPLDKRPANGSPATAVGSKKRVSWSNDTKAPVSTSAAQASKVCYAFDPSQCACAAATSSTNTTNRRASWSNDTRTQAPVNGSVRPKIYKAPAQVLYPLPQKKQPRNSQHPAYINRGVPDKFPVRSRFEGHPVNERLWGKDKATTGIVESPPLLLQKFRPGFNGKVIISRPPIAQGGQPPPRRPFPNHPVLRRRRRNRYKLALKRQYKPTLETLEEDPDEPLLNVTYTIIREIPIEDEDHVEEQLNAAELIPAKESPERISKEKLTVNPSVESELNLTYTVIKEIPIEDQEQVEEISDSVPEPEPILIEESPVKVFKFRASAPNFIGQAKLPSNLLLEAADLDSAQRLTPSAETDGQFDWDRERSRNIATETTETDLEESRQDLQALFDKLTEDVEKKRESAKRNHLRIEKLKKQVKILRMFRDKNSLERFLANDRVRVKYTLSLEAEEERLGL